MLSVGKNTSVAIARDVFLAPSRGLDGSPARCPYNGALIQKVQGRLSVVRGTPCECRHVGCSPTGEANVFDGPLRCRRILCFHRRLD